MVNTMIIPVYTREIHPESMIITLKKALDSIENLREPPLKVFSFNNSF